MTNYQLKGGLTPPVASPKMSSVLVTESQSHKEDRQFAPVTDETTQ